MPNPPFVSGIATTNKITLTITRPAGGVTSYLVQCYNPSDDKIKDVIITGIEDTVTTSLDNLKPYTTYTCDVTSMVDEHRSTTKVSVTTKEAGKNL